MIRGSAWLVLASAAALAAYFYSKRNTGLHQLEEPQEPVTPVPLDETATKAEAMDKTLVSSVNAWMLRQPWYRRPDEMVPPRIFRVDWVTKSATLPDGTMVHRGLDRIAEIRTEKGTIHYVLYTKDGQIKRLPT